VRYRLVTIGRPSRGSLAAPIGRYLARLRQVAGGAELIELKASVGDRRREVESAALAAAAQGRSIVLDERGTRWTTADLAAHVGALERRGESRLSLLIGGAEGTTEALRAGADEIWSLSTLTFAHELALVVALEQLYRIETLRAGHPYHRG
jgi:23S rRNA (pseudouridine1915-N3)-methyltransferase